MRKSLTMIHIANSPEQLAIDVAEWLVGEADAAIVARGRFTLVASGGTTSRLTYETLAQPIYQRRIDWSRTYIFWGDERTVPPNHPDSNYGMMYEALLRHIPISPEHIFRLRGEIEPHHAADEYERQIRTFFGDEAPCFDVVLLGMGTDGHTASLFPYTEALKANDQLVVANFVPKLNTWRLTMTAPMINASRQAAFIVTGKAKAAMLHTVLHGPHDPQQWPAQMIQDPLWFLDAEAASELDTP
ncbi:MAG: 6-phosphogluconolactonase [Phototrophicales bacterium]|nr:MAG: 6-phosphogluconolactonase [Phototrophicales bacterium]